MYNYKHKFQWCYLAKKTDILGGEMKPLSNTDDPLNPSAVNEVTHDISCNHVDSQQTQPDSYPSTSSKIHRNFWYIPKSLVLMLCNFQIHRQVPLSDAKISKETKAALYRSLQKYNTIILKCDNDIGQTDLIKMHISTRPYAAPVAAWPYT